MDTNVSHSTFDSTFERVVDLLNDAALENDTNKKVNFLLQVQELIVHKEPNLLDNFLDEMLAFQSDQEAEVRKLIAGFIEHALAVDDEVIPKILTSLMLLLSDSAVSVSKRAILSAGIVFSRTFKWTSQTRVVSDIMKECWDFVHKMKKSIIDRMESENDGVRAHIIKFIETVISCLSYPTPKQIIDSEKLGSSDQRISLELVPENHPLLDATLLEEEGRRLFQLLVQFTTSGKITSQTLMAIMTSVASIALDRPAFLLAVIELFEALQVELPPKLGKSQVSSVRKCLKMQLMKLAKRDIPADLAQRIGTLLGDLGATPAEIMKLMPKSSQGQSSTGKRKIGSSSAPEPEVKRAPISIPLHSKPENVNANIVVNANHIEKLADELIPKLDLQHVTDIVVASMGKLPDTVPSLFLATYTPISAASTPSQIQHMARLLSAQVLQSPIGKSFLSSSNNDLTRNGSEEKSSIAPIIGGVPEVKQETVVELPKLGVRQPHRASRHFKLADVTETNLSKDALFDIALSSMRRTLTAEQNMSKTKLHSAWVKLVSTVASLFGNKYKNIIFEFVCEDLRTRFDLVVHWLTHEYAVGRGFLTTFNPESHTSGLAVYDEWLTKVLKAIYQKTNPKLGLFGQLLLQSPSLTPGALDVLRTYCQDKNCSYLGMAVLSELATDRIAERARLLPLLLDFSLHENSEIRTNSIRELRKMYTTFEGETKQSIEDFAVHSLEFLRCEKPPAELLNASGSKEESSNWSDEHLKAACALFLEILPVNQTLLRNLSEAYVSCHIDVKKPLLKLLDTPIKLVGMQSESLLDFISSGPKGAETLIARVVHILTEGQQNPSPELVSRVYALYQERVDDVRFLIPVIPGLSKKEIFSILPDVVKLNPVVIKEVFSRIIGRQNQPGPCMPAELLVELHTLDPAKVDLKLVIKTVNLLLADKQQYTQEVMAVVLQHLIDLQPLPVLLMRTLLQSLSLYPRLIGLSMNIMHRLIQKQVWKYPRLWDGFIRCCQQTKPRSFEVLLQLPIAQLKNVVFEAAPDLKDSLLEHIHGLPEAQMANISRTTLAVLESAAVEQAPPDDSQPMDSQPAENRKSSSTDEVK